jgi:hypothetical protein
LTGGRSAATTTDTMSAVRTLAVFALMLAVAGCARCSPQPVRRDSGAARLPGATLRIAFITDLKGYLEPCGCTSRPLGGVDRLGGTLDRLRRDGTPTVFVAAGDLFLNGSSSESAAQQDRWQAETVVDVLDEIGLAAATPGRRDLTRGDDLLGSLRSHSDFAWLGAGAGAPSTIALAPVHMATVGATKVAFIGVTDAWDASQESLVAAAREAVASAERGGARLVVTLIRGDRRLARAVGLLPGVDFVIQGGLDAEHPEPPSPRGDAFVLEGGHQGQRLVVLDVYLRDDSPMRDESRWTRTAERERQLVQNAERRTQIAAWEQAGNVSPADLEAQREALRSGERAIQGLERDPDVAHGNAFLAEAIELAAGAPERSSIAARKEALARRINDHNRTAFADLLPPPVEEGTATYVGTPACRSCHASQFEWWRHHQHGRAYETLTTRHREYNLQCVSCHVTGYGRPGGATVTHNLEGALVNVGCESCHGPGSLHVSTRRTDAIDRVVPEATCTGCHNHEHSDQFAYDVYRARIVVPGHGLPVGAPPP